MENSQKLMTRVQQVIQYLGTKEIIRGHYPEYPHQYVYIPHIERHDGQEG